MTTQADLERALDFMRRLRDGQAPGTYAAALNGAYDVLVEDIEAESAELGRIVQAMLIDDGESRIAYDCSVEALGDAIRECIDAEGMIAGP